MKPLLLATLLLALALRGSAEPWQDALAQMPLASRPVLLTRTNTVGLMLDAFQSNGVVKALIFMPGATDEIYFYKRVNVPLPAGAAPSLLDCVAALTNHTFIQAAYQGKFLLLHTTEDMLHGYAYVMNTNTRARLEHRVVPHHFNFNDRDWDAVFPEVQPRLAVTLHPGMYVEDSWHFYRHTFAAYDLTEWEILKALALANKTTFRLDHWNVYFSVDNRRGPVPDVSSIRITDQ